MAKKPEKKEEEIFYQAIEKEPGERESYLKETCGSDDKLFKRVKALLAAYDSDDTAHHVVGGDSQATLDSRTHHEGPGTIIDRYKLLEKLGEGGFGVVWAAQQKKPVKRRVALKIIKLGMDTRQVVARFEAERQALALMDHPNIAKVLDGGSTEAGRPYFVMELVRGIPIIEYCDQHKLPTRERLELFIKVCHAIQHAHQKGIIHRDIKPSNILITLHDGVPVPRVIDFGIAKATQQELTEKTIYTRHHQFIGTPVYMSPEQAEMSGLDIDTRSDIYSLGVLLYELLTGMTPFDEKQLLQSGIDEMRKIIREQEPPRPSTKFATLKIADQSTTAMRHATESPKLISLLRGDLDWIVMKCLEKDRTRRYDTANGLASDITRHLSDEPVTARPPTAVYQFQKAWRRNRIVYTAAAMVVASLVIGISLSVWQAGLAIDARGKAEVAQEHESVLRQAAEAAKGRESVLLEEAQEAGRQQRRQAYIADMSLAQRLLDENKLTLVDNLLKRYDPEGDEEDVRGYFWTHLDNVSKGEEIHTIRHEYMVRSISLSKDGTRLASITMSGKVRLYEVNDDNDVVSVTLLQEHGGGLIPYGTQDGSVALSPDGHLLAADQQGTLKVWDAVSEELVFEKANVVAPISFSPDSRFLVGMTAAGLQLWDTADWGSRTLSGTSSNIDVSQIRALTFTPDSKRVIFSPSRFSAKLIIYNLDDESIEGELIGLDRPSVISTDGALVAAGSWDGHVSVWDLASRKRVKAFKAHTSIVLGLALSPDGKTLVTGGNENAIKVWDTETYRFKRALKGHHGQVWNLKFSGDGQYLASASMDQSVKMWRRSQTEAEPVAQDPADKVRRVARDPAVGNRTPKTHVVTLGDSIQAAIDMAAPGDHIEIAAGIHEITETITVDRPLVITGAARQGDKGPLPTVLKGASDLRVMIDVDTGAARSTVIRDLQIETNATGIQHLSGAFELRNCRVIVRSAMDFNAGIYFKAVSRGDLPPDVVTVEDCTLLVEYTGDTPEGTPPDVDVILADSGSRYRELVIRQCEIRNDVPNSISNGIETRSTTARMTIHDNRIHTQGIGIVLPNHVGAVDIRDNTVWSGGCGITVGTKTQERSNIIGNHITVDDRGLQVYPLFLQNHIGRTPSTGISIGHTSAGVTAGFFLKEIIGRGTNFMVEKNVLMGNPKYGISMIDSSEPEKFGPPTPNHSHNNTITGNDFTALQAKSDIALGASTYDNRIFGNVGVELIFREAGDEDRNDVSYD